MDNVRTEPTENVPATEDTDVTKTQAIVDESKSSDESTLPATTPGEEIIISENSNAQLVISDLVAVALTSNTIDAHAVDYSTNTTQNSDPVTDTVDDLETNRDIVIISSGAAAAGDDDKNVAIEVNKSSGDIATLDAALDNLNAQVTSLLDESQKIAAVEDEKIQAPLDEALANLNSQVLDLLKQSSETKAELEEICSVPSCSGTVASHRNQDNKYFDYSLYRETSASPPPHPLITYRWEDVRREKEKGGYPWTYLNPQELAAQQAKTKLKVDQKPPQIERSNKDESESIEHIDEAPPQIKVAASTPEPDGQQQQPQSSGLLAFNFSHLDTQKDFDSYSSKSSVKNSSSGILEVLHELENEEERKKSQLKCSTTQSHQDLSTATPKEDTKRSMFKSLLKRTHSAPKKIEITKRTEEEESDPAEPKSPPPVKCCHPIVEKLKTMADKQLHKTKAPKKPKTIKTVPLPREKKIVLTEQTRIIRLKDSPKADRKNVAAYLEKRDSDEIVEIVELDESPSETRKRREENRKAEDHAKSFVVPAYVTETVDIEPTVEELLEEEFKNDPPKKAPRKSKEHIYEEVKPVNDFASIVIQSILGKKRAKSPNESEKIVDQIEPVESVAIANVVDEVKQEDGEKPNELDSKKADDVIVKDAEEQKVLDIREESTSTLDADKISDIKVHIDAPDTENLEKIINQPNESISFLTPKLESKKETSPGAEKKVKFSQSTEEYQEKLAAEKGPEKEDVELPEHLKTAKRWSNMSDHEYEPIGEPITLGATATAAQPNFTLERPTVKITEPEPLLSSKQSLPDKPILDDTEENPSADELTHGTESPVRSITPFTDISRTEEIHTSQIDDSVIEELPLRREDRKKKSLFTNAGEHTKNLQHRISTQASNLRTKFRRAKKTPGGGGGNEQKASGSNLKSSLKSSPKNSQASPKERKKFKRPGFANKFKSIHMPKMSRPELPKFKIPDKFRRNRTEPSSPTVATMTITETTMDESASALDSGKWMTITTTTEDIVETKPTAKKFFEFGSYPKLFNRFKSHPSKDEQNDVESVADEYIEDEVERETTQPSTSSFSTHFATVPRAATKIKNSIMLKWNRSTVREDSESLPQSSTIDQPREDSVERRIRLASKMEMDDDEEEPLGILQNKEQIQLTSYDEENRAIHEISKAREQEFKSRKPLVHQDSDLVSDESNRDMDWEECERMRNKMFGTPNVQASTFGESLDLEKRERGERRRRIDSNFSAEETQSSGSSCDRRRTGIIEDIDDDEFFLRQRGVSQDNVEISKYISSAVREGFGANDTERNGLAELGRYRGCYDESFNNNNNHNVDNDAEPFRFVEKPRKPYRRRIDNNFNKSFESSESYYNRDESARQRFDDFKFENYHHRNQLIHGAADDDASDNEIPVATQYFPRNDDDEENVSFYDNEFLEGIDQPDNIIINRDTRCDLDYDSDVDDEEFQRKLTKPAIPKRRRKDRSPMKKDPIENITEVSVYHSELLRKAPIDEPLERQYVGKPLRQNHSPEPEASILETQSPNNSRYMINIKGTNGYATVKKEPTSKPPAPARRRKRSTKSAGDNSLQSEENKQTVDSPYPERPKRNYNIIVPPRPPRRTSSSSTIEQHKPPSIAASDITQYEEIDDIDANDESNLEDSLHKMQNRPLPAPPRPPRDKKHRHKKNNQKFDDDNDSELNRISFGDGSEFSTKEFEATEMATQTSLDIDEYLDDNLQVAGVSPERYTKTVEEILRNSNVSSPSPANVLPTREDNLSKGIQKFRESNQRSYSERSKTSADRPKTPSSRPLTPSALLIGQRIARSPVQTDATLTMQPVDDDENSKIGYRTDSAESEYVPYADEIDDAQIDTEDERIINAAIQRYQMLGSELYEHSPSPPVTLKQRVDKGRDDVDESIVKEPPMPPPRRKSSVSSNIPAFETLNITLAQPEIVTPVSSTQELDVIIPEVVNDLSIKNEQASRESANTTTLNVNVLLTDRLARTSDEPTEAQEQSRSEHVMSSGLQITPELMQEIIERVRRETMPIQQQQTTEIEHKLESEAQIECAKIIEKESKAIEKTSKKNENEQPPQRPPSPKAPTPPLPPTDYMPSSEIPASFYQLRTGISDDESMPSLPPTAPQRHRPRKHTRRCESSSGSEECHRRHHHHTYGQGSRMPESPISELSGQLIRACGRALNSSFNTAGNALFDLIRGLTRNQDEKQKDLSLVLVILIIIVASLMMLGMSGDRSVHHHHWDYFNPPDNLGRR